jgi:hypothetical protein
MFNISLYDIQLGTTYVSFITHDTKAVSLPDFWGVVCFNQFEPKIVVSFFTLTASETCQN